MSRIGSFSIIASLLLVTFPVKFLPIPHVAHFQSALFVFGCLIVYLTWTPARHSVLLLASAFLRGFLPLIDLLIIDLNPATAAVISAAIAIFSQVALALWIYIEAKNRHAAAVSAGALIGLTAISLSLIVTVLQLQGLFIGLLSVLGLIVPHLAIFLICATTAVFFVKYRSHTPASRKQYIWAVPAVAALVSAGVSIWSDRQIAARTHKTLIRSQYGNLEATQQSFSQFQVLCKQGDMNHCVLAGWYLLDKGRKTDAANLFAAACQRGAEAGCSFATLMDPQNHSHLERSCRFGQLKSCTELMLQAKLNGNIEQARKYYRAGCPRLKASFVCGSLSDVLNIEQSPASADRFFTAEAVSRNLILLEKQAAKTIQRSKYFPISELQKNAQLQFDAWNRPIYFAKFGKSFTVVSGGVDGKFNSTDDICLWTDFRSVANPFVRQIR